MAKLIRVSKAVYVVLVCAVLGFMVFSEMFQELTAVKDVSIIMLIVVLLVYVEGKNDNDESKKADPYYKNEKED